MNHLVSVFFEYDACIYLYGSMVARSQPLNHWSEANRAIHWAEIVELNLETAICSTRTCEIEQATHLLPVDPEPFSQQAIYIDAVGQRLDPGLAAQPDHMDGLQIGKTEEAE